MSDKNVIDNQSVGSGEVELGELISMLWKGKWFIFLFVSIFFSISVIYVLFFQTYTATIKIQKNTSYEMDNYTELNKLILMTDLAGLTPEQQELYKEKNPDEFINDKLLLELFMERLSTKEDFLSIAKSMELISPSKMVREDQNLEQALNQHLMGLEFILPNSQEELKNSSLKVVTHYGQVKMSEIQDKNQYQMLFEKTLSASNEFVRNSLLNKIQTKIELLKKEQQFKIEDLELKLKNELEDYQLHLNNRIAFLIEQSEIARQLGIAKNSIESQLFTAEYGIFTQIQNDSPYYLRGYEAIEKEIELLQSREDKELFIPELIQLRQELRFLKENKTISRLEMALNASHLKNKDDFTAAVYSISDSNFKKIPDGRIIMMASLLLGLVLGVFIVFILNITRRHAA